MTSMPSADKALDDANQFPRQQQSFVQVGLIRLLQSGHFGSGGTASLECQRAPEREGAECRDAPRGREQRLPAKRFVTGDGGGLVFPGRGISEQAASRKDHSARVWRWSRACQWNRTKASPVHASRAATTVPMEIGSASNLHQVRRSAWLCSGALLASMLAEGTPVRAKDFSQSCDEGPRMLPSMNASPGQRVQVPTWVHEVQVVRSFSRIERTSFICIGMAPDVDETLLPHVSRGKRKLDAGKNVAIGRNIAAVCPALHGSGFQFDSRPAGAGMAQNSSTSPTSAVVAEDLLQSVLADAQAQNVSGRRPSWA